DPKTKQFVNDGFTLPEAKSRASWKDADTLFVGTDFGPGSLTDSGYPRVVKEWKRGTPLSDAKMVFEGKATDVSVGASRATEKGSEREFVPRTFTFYTHELFYRKDGKLTKVEVPDDANAFASREFLFVELRTAWTVGDKTYPPGALLAADFEAFMNGE